MAFCFSNLTFNLPYLDNKRRLDFKLLDSLRLTEQFSNLNMVISGRIKHLDTKIIPIVSLLTSLREKLNQAKKCGIRLKRHLKTVRLLVGKRQIQMIM